MTFSRPNPDLDPGTSVLKIFHLFYDTEKFENRIRVRIHAKTPDPTGSGSETLAVDQVLTLSTW